MKPALTYPLTVYYDASCPMCAGEMHALKAADADDRLVLVDCSHPDFDDRRLAGEGVTRASMARLIHARDANGRWLVGIAVFEAAYEAAGFATLARLWGHRWLRPWWDRVYPWVARHRQALSRLGLQHVFRALAKQASRKSAAATCGARDGACSARPPTIPEQS